MEEEKESERSKTFQLGSKNFYLPIISYLKTSTNLTKLQNKLNISKQKLNYYLRELNKRGIIIKKERGWYEVVKEVKHSTKYGKLLVKDSIRGHAYILEAKFKKINDWDKRIEILTKKGINFKLVGAKLDIPRIKVLGRKVWLCNNHLRIFDKKEMSYYGDNTKESRNKALNELKLIVGLLEKKLGILIRPDDIIIKKEHYALIKNDLAIEENRKGNIIRISDEDGEWLLIDDSLEMGGELENIGKKSFKTNVQMSKWWNENKKDNFQTTPTKINNKFKNIEENLNTFSSNQLEITEAIKKSSESSISSELRIKQIQSNINGLNETIYQLIDVIKNKNGN